MALELKLERELGKRREGENTDEGREDEIETLETNT